MIFDPFESDPNKLYINGKPIYSASIWCINLNFKKITLKTGFVVQGHIYSCMHIYIYIYAYAYL